MGYILLFGQLFDEHVLSNCCVLGSRTWTWSQSIHCQPEGRNEAQQGVKPGLGSGTEDPGARQQKVSRGRNARGSSLVKRKLTQIRSLHWSWNQTTRHSQITELVAMARDEGRGEEGGGSGSSSAGLATQKRKGSLRGETAC